jgi:hypothetical protein
MSASAQAQIFRDAFKNEYEAFKKNAQMKKEMVSLRTNYTLVRKNVTKVTIPKRN